MSAKENRDKWVEALRSGEFTQGRSMLRSAKDKYCCLGVACELYRRETGNGQWEIDDDNGHYEFIVESETSAAFLPSLVREWLGLLSRRGSLRPQYTTGSYHSLSSLNDNPGSSFEEIARVIEKGELLRVANES